MKLLTYDLAIYESKEFAKKHMRLNSKLLRNHFQRKGYTHYQVLIIGSPRTYRTIDIKTAMFNQVMRLLNKRGIIGNATATQRVWDSRIFEEDSSAE